MSWSAAVAGVLFAAGGGSALAGTTLDWSELLTASGVLVTAFAGATVAILGAIDRSRRSTRAETVLLRSQVEWMHRRVHDFTVAMSTAGVPVPPEHAPYPTRGG